MIDRESETEKINQERGGEIERGKAIELSAMDRASGREREREWRDVLDQKQIGPIPFSFKSKQPSPNNHEPATQPITIKPRLKFNPTQAKPTTKIYQQPNPKIILLYKIPNPKIRIS